MACGHLKIWERHREKVRLGEVGGRESFSKWEPPGHNEGETSQKYEEGEKKEIFSEKWEQEAGWLYPSTHA